MIDVKRDTHNDKIMGLLNNKRLKNEIFKEIDVNFLKMMNLGITTKSL